MLQIIVKPTELWDAKREEFITVKEQRLQLEHSLVSLSKWEAKWKKPFFSKNEKTAEELRDYIRCMTLTQNVDENTYLCLTRRDIEKIQAYMEEPMTATFFSRNEKGKGGKKQITAELIYYWMISLQIPKEFEKWHLNRLFTLIQVCSEENKPPKKRSKGELMRRNAALNAARRKKYGTKG